MKSYLSLFLSLIVGTVFSQQRSSDNQFSLTGTTNLNDGEIIFLKYEDVNDSIVVKSGKFFFKGKVDEPTFAALINGKTNLLDGPKSIRIFIEPKKMEITAWKDKFYKAKLSGSETQEAFDAISLRDEYNVIRDSLEFWMSKIKQEGQTNFLKNNLDAVYKKRTQLFNVIDVRQIFYIKNNPKSFLSPFLLFVRNGLSQDSIKFYYDQFSPVVQNSLWGRMVYKKLNYTRLSNVGHYAPVFRGKSLTHEEIALGDFKLKKHVLLDFWGTWCVKCRELSPELISLYKKYKNKGLEILSIANDNDRQLWRNAILVDKTGLWKHVLLKDLNLTQSNDSLLTQYSISAFPTFILIDKEGRIIGRYVGSGNEFFIDLKNKLEEVLE